MFYKKLAVLLLLLLVPLVAYGVDSQAFIAAAKKGEEVAVKQFLTRGVDVNARDNEGRTALMYAAEIGHVQMMKALIATKGIDVNAQDKNGITALMRAVINGNPELVRMLLSKGADVNAKDKEGKTALMYAAKRGYTDIVKLLRGAVPVKK